MSAEMSSPFLFDPRNIPPEEVFGVDLQGRPLPCGQDICTPLELGCFEVGTDRDQAVWSCAKGMGGRVLLELMEASKKREALHVDVINRLSIDPETGILTRAAQKLIFEDMETSGLLSEMRERGYALQFLFGDINVLKAHNTLGGHFGGDEAIKMVANTMRGLFRREYDVVFRNEPGEQASDNASLPSHGYLKHKEMAQGAVEEERQYYAVSRFDNGDELSAMSFVPPDTDRRQQIDIHLLQNQVDRITEAFNDLTISYPLDTKITEETIAEIRRMHPSFNFSISEGIVTASVSISFAILGTPAPTTWEEFEHISKVTDSVVNGIKSTRSCIETRGAPISMVRTPII
jgi:hypothetical protein